MKSTNMAFDDAFAHVIAEIGGHWDKWKSDLGARDRESKSSAKYQARQDLVTHWKGEMTLLDLASLRPQCVKGAPCLNLLDARTAMEFAAKHLFEHVSLKRELHIAGMLLRRGIARVSVAQALAWVNSDPLFVRSGPDGKLLTTREVRDAENKMIRLAAQGQGKHEALGGGKEWAIRHPLVGACEEQNQAVHHVLGSNDLITSFTGPAGAGKTELMTEAVTAIESLSGKRVMILAPSSPSVEVLRAQGFANADTLQQFLVNKDLQQAAIGQVLWVDEAGFLSVRQILELEEFAVQQNCRLVVTGDTKQHHSVQRGDALRILERSGVIAQAVLTKIHHLRIPELRAAIEDLSKGWTTEGFDKLDKFPARLPCIWKENCSNQFISVDSKGTVAQCDCWVTSYPESFFGNMFREPDLTRMLRESPARRQFVERPKHLIEHEDCLSCRYLSICHGGCPVRTYSALGTMLAKDPYCEVYKAVFGRAETHSREILRRQVSAWKH